MNRRHAAIVACLVVGMVCAFLLGRIVGRKIYVPGETKERVVTQTVTKVEYQDRVIVKYQDREVVKREWRVVTLPSGERREEVKEELARETDVAASRVLEGKQASNVVQVAEKTTISLPLPAWSAALLVGTDRLSVRPNTFGAAVDRRVFSWGRVDITLGAWGLHTHGKGTAGGLSLGARF